MGESIPANSITQIVVAGLSMGIAGSLHCIGMCGPLVTAVFHSQSSALGLKFLYNGGRIFVYIILGGIAGIIGFALDVLAVQKFLSVLLGVVLVIFGLSGFNKLSFPAFDKSLSTITQRLKLFFGNWLKQRGILATFMLGILNGFLPCGLTYMALAYALTLPNAQSAGLFMFSFGLGTFPAMIGIPVIMGALGSKYSSIIRKFNALILLGIGALLIWRGYMQFHDGMNGTM